MKLTANFGTDLKAANLTAAQLRNPAKGIHTEVIKGKSAYKLKAFREIWPHTFAVRFVFNQ